MTGTRGRCWRRAGTTAWRLDCGTPSGGWARAADRRRTPAWSSCSTTSSASCRRRSPSIVRAMPGPRGCGRDRHHAGRVLDLAREDDDLAADRRRALLGLAAWTDGDLETAYRMFAEGMARCAARRAMSRTPSAARSSWPTSGSTQGRLRDAMRTYEQALQLASEQGEPFPRGTADLYVGLSELQRERDELDAADAVAADEQRTRRAHGLARKTGTAGAWPWRASSRRRATSTARSTCSRDAERPKSEITSSPNGAPGRCMDGARAGSRRGELAKPSAGRVSTGISADDDLSYVREFEHITLARVLLASGATSEALGLLDRLLTAADRAVGRGASIEILVLQALAHQTCGRTSAALASAGARPDAGRAGGVRPRLRRRRAAHGGPARGGREPGIAPDYVRRLLVRALRRTDAGGRPARGSIEPLSSASSRSSGCSQPTRTARKSPAGWWCRSTRCGATPRASTPSSA